jgi:hypothetical protein
LRTTGTRGRMSLLTKPPIWLLLGAMSGLLGVPGPGVSAAQASNQDETFGAVVASYPTSTGTHYTYCTLEDRSTTTHESGRDQVDLLGKVVCDNPGLSVSGGTELYDHASGSALAAGSTLSGTGGTTGGYYSTGSYSDPYYDRSKDLVLHVIVQGWSGLSWRAEDPVDCQGVGTSRIECWLIQTFPQIQDTTADSAVSEANWLEGFGINEAFWTVGFGLGETFYAAGESLCAAGQVTNPDPSRGDGTCQTVGREVGAAESAAAGAVGTVEAEAAYVSQEAGCVAGQATNPNPSNGDSTCRTVGSAVQAGEGAAGGALGTVAGAAGSASQEANCIAGQVTSPNPSSGDSTCRTVGSAVQAGEGAAGYAGQEGGCAASQVTSPDPTRGDSACQSVGNVTKQANDDAKHVADIGGTPSASCMTGQVADGYAGSTYVKLRTQTSTSDPKTTWVCYQIVHPNGASVGGRLDVTGASASPSIPSTDDNGGACAANSATNAAPPPHPVVAGSVVGQQFSIDDYSAGGTGWLCVQIGSVSKRVIVNVPGVGAPSLASHLDQPNTGAAPPVVADPQVPSGSCQSGAYGSPDQLMNMNVSGTQAWLYDIRSNGGQTVHVCARLDGAVKAGGMLTISTAGSPGITPSVTTSSTDPDLSVPCPLSIVSLTSPVQLSLSTSNAGATSASVCVKAGTSQERVTVGTSGTLVPPTINWQADPDTPA